MFLKNKSSYRATSATQPNVSILAHFTSPRYTFSINANQLAAPVSQYILRNTKGKSTHGVPRRVGCQFQKISVGCPRSTLRCCLTGNQPGAGPGAWARTSASCLPSLHPAKRPHSSENYKAALDEPRGPCAQNLSFLWG